METLRERFIELLTGKRAALFDFDGVIADSEHCHFLANNEVFQRRHGHTIDPEEYWVHWTSRGEGILGEMRRHGIKGADPVAIREEKDRIFYDYCRSGRIRFFDGALDLMRSIEAKGLKTAIASNSQVDWIEAIFRSNGVLYRPPFIVGKTQSMRPKPAPDIFLAAAREVGEAPGACLVFEDAQKGMQAAHEAGMPCIIIRNPLNRNIDFSDAELVVASHQELLSLLGHE